MTALRGEAMLKENRRSQFAVDPLNLLIGRRSLRHAAAVRVNRP
jgi:hypothetical protein